MKYFWLGLAIVSFVVITYLCITENYKTWIYYYVITGISLLMYFMKVWMVNRMEKHVEYLESKKNDESGE